MAAQTKRGQPNPIICGRRNCSRCTRWRLLTDYHWRWKRDGSIKSISGVCTPCYNKQQRSNWRKKSKAERQIIGRRNNDYAARRRDLDRKQLAELQEKFAAVQELVKIPDNHVEFLPFRMWLLWYRQRYDSMSQFAESAHVSTQTMEKWLDGFEWQNSSCEPTPIRSVSLARAEDVLTHLGHPEAIYSLYPGRYDW